MDPPLIQRLKWSTQDSPNSVGHEHLTRLRFSAYCSFSCGTLAALYALLVTSSPSLVRGGLVAVSLLCYLNGCIVLLLFDRLKDAARADALTSLLNRRGFEEAFQTELERARRTRSRLSIVIGDLDHFKQVNDRFGHHAGDEALKRFAAILDQERRRFDIAARMGDEEFALLLPETDQQGAYTITERLCEVARETFADRPVPLTVSFGIASFPAHGSSAEPLLRAADQALCAAKAFGRNRSVIYGADVMLALGNRQLIEVQLQQGRRTKLAPVLPLIKPTGQHT